jgi:hypothetical protein
VNIYVQWPHEHRALPRVTFSLQFASKQVECSLQPINDPTVSPKQYVVSAEVPAFLSTGCPSPDVPLRMIMASHNQDALPLVVEVGAFCYSDQSSRKRRLSSGSGDAVYRNSKKPSAQQLKTEQHSESGVYCTSPYSTFGPTPSTSSLPQQANGQGNSPQLQSARYPASVASAPSVKAQSPHTPPSWSPSFTPMNQVIQGPKPSTTPSQASTVDIPTGKTPPLMRTSTIPQSSPFSGSTNASHSFNLYAMYPSKAVLKLNGDLDSMAERWTNDEWDTKRRLVRFTRRQNISTIHADFVAVSPEDYQKNSICISCIWWEEKRDFYVTSVDTIFLLESLVAVRFTVEEKNRIRRNLEGFRPLTVSKSKADSEEFFKLIMGFPSPKPRNIEKDVKVFPWKILAHALKKIIGKYSASYSSTASALPTPISHYASNGVSDSGTDGRASHSPQPNGINPGASQYTTATAPFQPHIHQQRVSVPISTGPPVDLRPQVLPMNSDYPYSATHSHQYVPQYPQGRHRSPQTMTAAPAAGRILGPWDSGNDNYTTFENGHQDANPNMNSYQYGRILNGMPTSQDYMAPTSYTLSHPGSS